MTASPPAATPSAASPSASLDPAFDELEFILDDASASAPSEEEAEGIPGLGAVEVSVYGSDKTWAMSVVSTDATLD